MAWNEPGGNGKDPWGQRKNEPGPPDLDELVKKMQDRLRGFLGGAESGDKPPSSFALSSLGWIFFLLLLAWSLFGFYTIQPAERGVELRFGKYDRTTEQGLHWHIPYPVEEVIKVNVEEVRAWKQKSIMLTQDENIVDVELVVQYQVKEAENYLFNVYEPDDTLRQATESALREVVGTSRMDDVLTSGRDLAAAQMKQLLQEILDRYNTGLLVRSINMQNAQPPEAVQTAFADVIKAREDEERLKNTAEAYANEVVQKAGGMADRLRQEAEAYKVQVVAYAEGETKRFLSVLVEYQKAPAITRQRLYLETIEAVLSNSSKILLDLKNAPSLTVLPLDKLLTGDAIVEGESPPTETLDNRSPALTTSTEGQQTLRPSREESRTTRSLR